MISLVQKCCKACSIMKNRDEFYKLKGTQYKESWDVRDSLCKPCRSMYQTNRRRVIKKECVERLGGICVDCGLKTDIYAVYDFHHLDVNTKDVAIGASNKSFENLKSELDKCVLLCANCHRIRHSEVVL